VATPSAAHGIARGEQALLLGPTGLADKGRGIAATPQTPYALASITRPMTATARQRGEQRTVSNLQMARGRLSGAGDGRLEVPDAARRDHTLHLDLAAIEGMLCGSVAAVSTLEELGGGAPGKRRGNAACFWTSLRIQA